MAAKCYEMVALNTTYLSNIQEDAYVNFGEANPNLLMWITEYSQAIGLNVLTQLAAHSRLTVFDPSGPFFPLPTEEDWIKFFKSVPTITSLNLSL